MHAWVHGASLAMMMEGVKHLCLTNSVLGLPSFLPADGRTRVWNHSMGKLYVVERGVEHLQLWSLFASVHIHVCMGRLCITVTSVKHLCAL